VPYTFGDSDLAADRLRLLADTFAPTTRRFLVRDAPLRPAVALDLGCGPGATSVLLRDTVRPGRTIGVDSSPAFLEQAREHVDVLRLDLAVDDLPPADLVVARYLLSHLPDPEGRVATWRRGARVLIEENTRLRIHHPVFRRYEDTVAEVMETNGGDLYVGERLAPLADRATFTTVTPPAGVVARLFGMNLATWGAGLGLDDLAADLQSLAVSDERGLVVFELAQLVFEATSSA
jgi:SAM-dependent methyltransferase